MKKSNHSKVKSIDQEATTSYLSGRNIILRHINNDGT